MSSLRSLANEATSSTGNMQPDGFSAKRKRSDTNCHQCHRNDKETVVGCTKCKKKYCILCITRWYTALDWTDVVEACPVCRKICNCAACLKPGMANKNLPLPHFKLGTADKMQDSKDVVRVLLPSLKQFVAEENKEREEEARIRGVPITGLNLLKSNHNDHMLCDNCKSSILDVHRSCLSCWFKLFVTCCGEIRDSHSANFRYHVPGDACSSTKSYGVSVASSSKDSSRTIMQWIMNDNGAIVCPPESRGGCGRRNLELMSRYPTNWVSEMLVKAEAVANVGGKVTDAFDTFGMACLVSSHGTEAENMILLAHQENSDVNYLNCPTALAIEKNDLKHFQWHVQRGESVVVSDVLSRGTGLSWEPMVMWRACRKPKKPDHHIKDFTVLNCVSWREETINIHKFFKGYAEGLFDAEGRLKILRLEDWPTAESFQEQLPRHFLEFVRCLPFMLYTHPHDGHLNMSTRLPIVSRKADLGPKMSICYGVGQELGSSSLSMMHYALSDRVDILMHTAEICLSHEQLSRVEKLRSKVEGFKEPEGGAIWDIFRRQDVPKLEEYLRKHARELKHVSHLQQLVHPVHEKAFYLTVEHKRKLKEEFGDAVFVPAGCPHQISYLKSCTSVAFNFVAPESIGECILLAAEYRCIPQNHRCKEDKLQVKQMILHAVGQAVHYLETITLDASRSQVKAPLVHANIPQNIVKLPMQIPLKDLVFMKQDLEAKRLTLEKQGHLVQPHLRVHLEQSIRDLLVKIDKEMEKNVVGSSSS